MKKEQTEVKKLIITNWHNYKPVKGEENSGEILVVPDQAYTIEEIFEKFRRGISLPIENEDIHYLLDEDSNDFDNIDLRQIAKDAFDIDESAVNHRLKRGTQDASKILTEEDKSKLLKVEDKQEAPLAT